MPVHCHGCMGAIQLTALIGGGLSVSVTSEDLREIFSAFGPVMWSRIETDGSGEDLGIGYVVMNAEAAAKAIQALDGKTIAGQKVTIAHTAIPPLPGIAQP
jgi:RNA recognition motif-containing protein